MTTPKNLSELFEQARRAQAVVPVSDIKSLLESGKSSPLAAKPSFRPRRITRLFNPLKFIVMITPIVIITSALLILNPGSGKKPAEQKDSLNLTKAQVVVGVENRKPGVSQNISRNTSAELLPSSDKEFSTARAFVTGKTTISDTIFQGVILELSKEELARLGFMFDSEGYYYLNQLPDGSKLNFWSFQGPQGGSYGFGAGGYVNQSNKADLIKTDFYPVLLTNLEGKHLYPLNTIKGITDETFELANDTLVPVYFSSRNLGGYTAVTDQLVWFKVSDDFFNRIHNERVNKSRKILEDVSRLRDQMGTRNRVEYLYNIDLPQPKILKLKPEYLNCMGIIISQSRDSVKYEFNYNGSDYRWFAWEKGIGIKRLTIGLKDAAAPARRDQLLYSINRDINNRAGNFPVGFPVESADLILPVQIDDSTLTPTLQALIFWIYPNEKFFSCLPPDIARPMIMEFNYQLKRLDPNLVLQLGGSIGLKGGGLQKDAGDYTDEPVPCVYFTNLCETLSGLEYVNLYPNPATSQITVDLVLQKAKKIRFRVFDLSGKLISGDGPPQNYPEGGRVTYSVDISRLNPGFYLMVMTDEEGQRVTRRFVKN